MKMNFLLAMSLIGLQGTSYGQKYLSDRKNLANIHISQLFLQEVQVSYERAITNEFSIETTLGYRIPRNVNYYDAMDDAPFATSIMDYEERGGYMPLVPFSKGFLISVSPKLNFNRHFYAAGSPFFRSYSFDHKYLIFPYDGDDPRIMLRSEKQRSVGVKFFLGARVFTGNFPLYFDFNAGVGMRNRTRLVTDFGEKDRSDRIEDVELYPTPVKTRDSRPIFSLQLGMKMGVVF